MDGRIKASLIEAAQGARANAYAPYSVYRVGAAALGANGSVYPGCNVENASYGLTVCAERNAVARMVGDGETKLAAMAVATQDGNVPCGACLQVMVEFAVAHEMPILLVGEKGDVRESTLPALMPDGFKHRP